MRLTNLLLLAGAAVAANSWMNKTEKGRQFKKDLKENAGRLTDKLKDTVSNYTQRNNTSDGLFSDANPTGSSFSSSGSPM